MQTLNGKEIVYSYLTDPATGKNVNVEENGGLAINIQDQTSPPVDFFFLKESTSFTLAADTVASTATVLSYTFTATGGHGLIVGNEITLTDPVGARRLYATVLAVATDLITIDRPIDFLFPAASTTGKVVSSEMNVNGAVTPQIFSINPVALQTDIVRIIIKIIDNAAMDDGKFGGITALTRGIVFRVLNSYQETIFNFKNNGDIKAFAFDGVYTPAAQGPSGAESFAARVTFGGADKHGVVLRLGAGDEIQWVIQDDLTTLQRLRATAQGHQVTS